MITPYTTLAQPQNQWLQQMLTQGTQTAPIQQNTVKVNGRPGAEAYQMGPNSDALLLDNTAPMVWLVQTDGAGYKSVTPYDIFPHEEVKQEDIIKKLEARIEKLEERLNADVKLKPNSTEIKRKPEQRNATSICSDDER